MTATVGQTMKPTCRTRVEGDVAYITLTKGYEAVIDITDVLAVGGYHWSADVQEHTVYAVRGCRSYSKGKQDTIRLHRFILGIQDGVEVDHKDGNGLNNRRSNLRSSTRTQNLCNVRMYKNNISGFKGVSYNTRSKKWFARIAIHGKTRYLGYFKSPEHAHAAYVEASKQLHGEFSRFSHRPDGAHGGAVGA